MGQAWGFGLNTVLGEAKAERAMSRIHPSWYYPSHATLGTPPLHRRLTVYGYTTHTGLE